MVSVNSAGNYGSQPWRYLGAPADGNVLAVAAVDSLGSRAYFSSVGVLNGSRVKPNIAAMGMLTVVGLSDGTTDRRNGTSFSSPIIAGMAACLWQARQGVSNFRIYDAIQESANQFSNPDSLLGYGIPDFVKALNILSAPQRNVKKAAIYPNPFSGSFKVGLSSDKNQTVFMEVYDGAGKDILKKVFECLPGENYLTVADLSRLNDGVYFLKLYSESWIESHQIVKVVNY
jgi:subtilisin family serine protease